MKCFAYIFIVFFIFSCKTKEENGSPCFQPYTLNNLFKNYDSSRFEIHRLGETTEIRDTLNKLEDGSFYIFDKYNNLKFYCYIEDSTNAYDFGITFDSLGNEIKKTGTDVIRWQIIKKGNDSLHLIFLLFKINRSYGDITLTGSDFSKHISLFEAFPSNTIGANIIITRHQNKTIFITGVIRNDCLMKERRFIDSVHVPKYLIN